MTQVTGRICNDNSSKSIRLGSGEGDHGGPGRFREACEEKWTEVVIRDGHPCPPSDVAHPSPVHNPPAI